MAVAAVPLAFVRGVVPVFDERPSRGFRSFLVAAPLAGFAALAYGVDATVDFPTELPDALAGGRASTRRGERGGRTMSAAMTSVAMGGVTHRTRLPAAGEHLALQGCRNVAPAAQCETSMRVVGVVCLGAIVTH